MDLSRSSFLQVLISSNAIQNLNLQQEGHKQCSTQ
jgi:hypothetical protein